MNIEKRLQAIAAVIRCTVEKREFRRGKQAALLRSPVSVTLSCEAIGVETRWTAIFQVDRGMRLRLAGGDTMEAVLTAAEKRSIEIAGDAELDDEQSYEFACARQLMVEARAA